MPRSSIVGGESQFRNVGYNLTEFTAILHHISLNSVPERDDLESLYRSLDKNNKGWIDRDDFAKVRYFNVSITLFNMYFF